MNQLANSVMGLVSAIQVMARGLGGRIGRNTSGRFVLTGAPSHPNTPRSCALTTQSLQSRVAQIPQLCSAAVEELRLEPAFQKKPYFIMAAGLEELSSEQSSSLRVLESHGDQVSIYQLEDNILATVICAVSS